MTRNTSIDAYNKIKADGLLSALQMSIYAKLFESGPMTQGEIWLKYFQHMQRHSVAPRFAELKAMGVLTEVGEKPCPVSGINAILWDVTDQLPHEPVAKPTTVKEFIVGLLERIESLEAKVKDLQEGREPNGQGLFALRNH